MANSDRMRRKLLGSVVALLASPTVRGQPSRRRVVVVSEPGEREFWIKLFAEAGLRDGRDVDLLFGIGKGSRSLAEFARRLVGRKPDVLLVPGSQLLFALREIEGTIPVVFYSFGADPVKLGLVRSMRRPGGNITGTTVQGIDAVKVWQVLMEIRPRARSIVCIFDRRYLEMPWMAEMRAAQVAAASRLRLRRAEVVVDPGSPFSEVEKSLLAENPDLLDVTGGYTWPWLADLMRLVERRSIPAAWEGEAMVRRGGLMCLNGSIDEAIREAVQIVAHVLKGESPSGIPIYQSNAVILMVNLRTARAMGITLPPSVLLQANKVVDEEGR